MKKLFLINLKSISLTKNSFCYFLFWILALLILAFFSWQFGLKQFGGFDQSALIDTAWRLLLKQDPYHDFYLTTPVGFYLGAWLAFRFFGVKWSSFVLINIVYIIITYTLQSLCLNTFISKRYSLGITFACGALAMIVPSYWWYNSITMMTACVFVSASIAYLNYPTRLRNQVIFAISLFLMALMKPNMSGLLIPVVIISLLILNSRKRTIALVFVSSLLFFALLFVVRINPVDIISSYLGVAQTRGLPQISLFFQDKPFEEYITIPLLLLCAIPYLGIVRPIWNNRNKISSPLIVGVIILISGTAIGYLGMVTNSDSNLVVGLPLIFICPMILLSWFTKNAIIDMQVPTEFSIAILLGSLATIIGLFINIASPFALPFTDIRSLLWGLCLVIMFMNILLALSDFRKWSFVLTSMILVFSIAAICVGQSRMRVKYIGPFYTEGPLIQIQNIPFFNNFDVSPQLGTIVSDIQQALAKYSENDNSIQQDIYFGPRIQFAYAAFNIKSPTKLPIWFHPGVSYSLQDSQKAIDNFIEHQFDLCIFAKSGDGPDTTYMPIEILDDLNKNYIRIDMSGIIVYKLDINKTTVVK